jgi:hypothetical protein
MLKTIWRILMSNREQTIREVIDKFGNGNNSINYESEVFRARLAREINERLEELEKNA